MLTNRHYKSSVFSLLFGEPAQLRQLYNTLAGTNYDESTRIVITTLTDALYMDRINDLSFTIDHKQVVLIEHQSSLNPNMSLRLLIYIARVYEKLIDSKKVYSRTKLVVPRPEFLVLYNGPDTYPARGTMKLSEHFAVSGNGGTLELETTVININRGKNPGLEAKNRTLRDYAVLVAKARETEQSLRAGKTLDRERVQELREEALLHTIVWCRNNGILSEFLEEHASEVLNMLVSEWNWDEALEVRYEDGLLEGMERGLEKGLEQGIEQGLERGLEQGMEKGLEQGMERGIEQGREQGIEQGLERGLEQGLERGVLEGKLEIARNMKARGVSLEQIAVDTGLSLEAIRLI